MSIPMPHKTAAVLIIAFLLAACRPNAEPPAENTQPAAATEQLAQPAPPTTSDQPPATNTPLLAATPEQPTATPEPPAPPTATVLPPALLPDLGPAPDITNEVWLNTDGPLNLAALQGQVVLVEFWTFG